MTRQLVLAATQTFEDTFTVNDVLAEMTGNQKLDPPERLRVRQVPLEWIGYVRQTPAAG